MKLHRIFGVTLIAFVLAIATLYGAMVRAAAFSTDQSDVWSVPNEAGWGIQFVQRGSAIFATMYVYGPSGQPTFYTATLEAQSSALTWSGDLIVTTGPWFGTVPFNSGLVTRRKVGTMTWSAPYVNGGTLTYSVDGVFVTKPLERLLIRFDDYSGTYIGGLQLSVTNCSNPAFNGSGHVFATIDVTQTGQTVRLNVVSQVNGASFTITGTLDQDGQFGSVIGNYSSSVGEAGNATLVEMNVQLNAFTARSLLQSTNNGCKNTGYLGGIRSR